MRKREPIDVVHAHRVCVCVCRDVKMLPLECVGGSQTYLTDKKFLKTFFFFNLNTKKISKADKTLNEISQLYLKNQNHFLN